MTSQVVEVKEVDGDSSSRCSRDLKQLLDKLMKDSLRDITNDSPKAEDTQSPHFKHAGAQE
jgi:hypothetical protein